MNLLESIKLVNSKQKTVMEIVDVLQCSRDLYKSVLKENGYSYDNKQKLYIFTGEGEQTDFNLIPVIKERQEKQNNNRQKSEKNQIKVINKSDNITEESDDILTKEEIKILKRLANRNMKFHSDFELNHSFSKLPARKPTKKATHEISKETFDQFERFATVIAEKHRMSKNDLIEMALIRMMDDFKDL